MKRFELCQDSLDSALKFVRDVRIVIEGFNVDIIPDVLVVGQHCREFRPFTQTPEQLREPFFGKRLPVGDWNVRNIHQFLFQLNQSCQRLAFRDLQRRVGNPARKPHALVKRLPRLFQLSERINASVLPSGKFVGRLLQKLPFVQVFVVKIEHRRFKPDIR